MFGLGRALDNRIIRPLLGGEASVVPGRVQRLMHNRLRNLSEPVVLVRDLLEARFSAGAKTTIRFVGNSTVGLAGLFDPAARAGLRHHDKGFGDTLGRYGAGIDLLVDPLPWGG